MSLHLLLSHGLGCLDLNWESIFGQLTGHGQLSLKVPNIEFDFDVRFSMYLYLLAKPNVKNENY